MKVWVLLKGHIVDEGDTVYAILRTKEAAERKLDEIRNGFLPGSNEVVLWEVHKVQDD